MNSIMEKINYKLAYFLNTSLRVQRYTEKKRFVATAKICVW